MNFSTLRNREAITVLIGRKNGDERAVSWLADHGYASRVPQNAANLMRVSDIRPVP